MAGFVRRRHRKSRISAQPVSRFGGPFEHLAGAWGRAVSIDCRKKLFAALVGVSVADVTLPATPDQLEEVLVTARRTLENAQDVPMALTALSTERLTNADVTSLEKLSTLIPDMILTRGNSGSGMVISLRGIGPNFSSIGIEQSVAVVIDDAYYAQGRVIDEALVDLGSVEVLKGPQALFFGKNSTAGVISITTADPGPRFESRIRAGYEFASQNPNGSWWSPGRSPTHWGCGWQSTARICWAATSTTLRNQAHTRPLMPPPLRRRRTLFPPQAIDTCPLKPRSSAA
jgi:outer membrane receptor for Fe3+-dicitrate